MKLTLRHSLALLRQSLDGMTQKELADLAGCSRLSIQAVELGKLKLSPSLAFRISRATGCNYSWLLAGDISTPPVNHAGLPYSEKDFALAQDAELQRLSTYHSQRGRLELAESYRLLRLILDETQKDIGMQSFFLKRLEHFVRCEIHQFPELRDRVYQELQNQSPHLHKMFLSPVDTRACDVMEQDAGENRRTIVRYRKELEQIQKRTIAKREALEDSTPQQKLEKKPTQSKRLSRSA